MNRFAFGFSESFRAVFSDRVAVVTLVGAVVLYSFFYPAAYRHQVAQQLPVLVVDYDHSPASRELIRAVRGVRAVRLLGSAPSVAAARDAVERRRIDAFIVVPAGFERSLLRGEPAVLALYGSGAVLSRAGSALAGLGDAVAGMAPAASASQAIFAGVPAQPPLRLIERPLFNPREGYGSAIVPGVAELIIQQTLVIGMVVLVIARRAAEGRRRLAWSRPGLLGVMSAFCLIGLVNLLYYAGFMFWFQDYPRGGNLAGLLLAGALFVLAVVGFALFIGSFCRDRERAFALIAVTSLPMFFLANLSWPVASTPAPLVWLAALLPSTPGINALVKFNQLGAGLPEAAAELRNLAGLALLYGGLSVWRYRPA